MPFDAPVAPATLGNIQFPLVTAVRTDEVVLLDSTGRPNGTARKDQVHGLDTPFHLLFRAMSFGPMAACWSAGVRQRN